MDKNQNKSNKTKNSEEPDVKAAKQSNSEVGKYLTDMKELPPVSKETEDKKAVPPKKENNLVQKEDQPTREHISFEKKDNKDVPEEISAEVEENPSRVFTLKDIILGTINLLSIVFLIFLLTKLPGKAKEFQSEKLIEIQNLSNPESEFRNLEQDSEKADRLEKLFLDESGIVNFVGEVEKLKTNGGSINKVSFASQRGVKDTSGLIGIPVIIELRGNWQTIGTDLEKIQGLPFLFRPVSIDSGPAKDDSAVIILSYGGFLYVDEKKVLHE